MEDDLHGIDIFASGNITTFIWMSQKVVCWRAGFSVVTAVFLVYTYISSAGEVVRVGTELSLKYLAKS